jgi:hypothetical protein
LRWFEGGFSAQIESGGLGNKAPGQGSDDGWQTQGGDRQKGESARGGPDAKRDEKTGQHQPTLFVQGTGRLIFRSFNFSLIDLSMTQIWALRSRLEKQPTDLRQNASISGTGH